MPNFQDDLNDAIRFEIFVNQHINGFYDYVVVPIRSYSDGTFRFAIKVPSSDAMRIFTNLSADPRVFCIESNDSDYNLLMPDRNTNNHIFD
jgi:hypothetical protein